MQERPIGKTAGFIGLSAVGTLLLSLLVFGNLNDSFHFFDDFISKLGAQGEPNALWWNLIGFVLVGLLMALFGALYGHILKDVGVSVLLSFFGVGYALTSIPMDMEADRSTVSKAHIVAICLGLACWMFGLSRLSYRSELKQGVRNRANVAAGLLVVSMLGYVLGLWSMPFTHRLVFTVVFGWTTLASWDLVVGKPVENL